MQRILLGLLAVALLGALSGCGDGRPPVVPVSGTVKIDGQPLTRGTIGLIPDDARPAYGDIGPDGRFTLSTFREHDGVVVGKHKVTVLSSEILSASSLKWHAPKEYGDLATTDLEVEITGPTDNLEINLTWQGTQPLVESFAPEGSTSGS